jgi:hypothetical protein
MNEVERYIQHRWRVAGGKNSAPFSPGAVANVARWSKGIPRLINSICDNALMLAFAEEASCVSGEHIDSAATDLLLIDHPSPQLSSPPPLPSVALPTEKPGAPIAPLAAPIPPAAIKTVVSNGRTPPSSSMISRLVDKFRGRSNGSHSL